MFGIIQSFVSTWLTEVGAVALIALAAYAWFLIPGIGRLIALVCIGVAMLMIGRATGFRAAESLCDSAQLRQEVAARDERIKDLEHKNLLALQDQNQNARQAEEARIAAAKYKGVADELTSQILALPLAPNCDWTDRELERLRSIPIRPTGATPRRRPNS